MKQSELKQISGRSYRVIFTNRQGKRLKSDTFDKITKLFEKVTHLLYQEGYKFNDPKLHSGVFSRLYTMSEVNGLVNTKHRVPQVFSLGNGKYFSYDRTEKYCTEMIVKMMAKHGYSNIIIERDLIYTKPLVKGTTNGQIQLFEE